MVIVETSFPRGGTIKPKTEQQSIDFGARQEKRKKKKSKQNSKNARKSELATELKAFSAELLNHKTIQEGMLIMAVIRTVDATFLKVSLPGRIVGIVPALAISESYKKLMQKYVDGNQDNTASFKPLTELFHVGQVVYVKVTEIVNTERKRLNISLSMKPADVHEHFNHQLLRKTQILGGAIEEIQDHGYVIETGITNLRCFLPLDKSAGDGLNVGQLICMKIEKLTQTTAASTAVCKMLKGENRKVKDQTEPNLDYLLPTSIVGFTIVKILKNGLQGTIMNGAFTAYVNEHQLTDISHVPSDYEVNATIPARILYTMPLTRLVYLSLRTNIEDLAEAEYKRGDIIENARVHHIGTGGIVLDLNSQAKGLVSFKSIKMNLIGNYDQDEVLAKYRKNSKHTVRILEYDLIDGFYACSDNPAIVHEKFYTLDDLRPGDFVTGVIAEKNSNGSYHIRIGKVRGLLETMFMAATVGQLEENSKIRCRVIWTSTDRKVAYLTNRNEYMSKSVKLLTQRSQVKANRIFTGTIVKAYPKYFIIRFFGSLKGILYKNRITGFNSNELGALYEGATMNFRIVSHDDDKIVISLAEQMHKLGEICQARVTNVIEQGLEIAIRAEEDEEEVKGLIPIRLLSDFQELLVGHLKTYSLNDSITAACVMRNIYSVRDVKEFSRNGSKTWEDIRSGDILKGVVKNVDNEVIEVTLPIINYDKITKIHMKMFLEHCVKDSNVVLVPDQVVYVKVLSKENITRSLTCTAKLVDVWDRQLKSTGKWFVDYLREVKTLRKRFKAQGKSIAAYKIGEQTTGKVIGFNKMLDEWTVELPEGVRGLLKSSLVEKDKTVQEGAEKNFVVLWIDYSNEVIYLSHKPGDIEHISVGMKLADKFKNQVGVQAKILLKTNDFILCTMKKGKNPIIFIPARLHFNDFENVNSLKAKEGEFCRLAFIHETDPVAVFESTWKLWNKLNNKRKASGDGEDADRPAKKTKKTPVLQQEIKQEESISIKEEESDEEPDISIKEEVDDIEEEDVDENMEADGSEAEGDIDDVRIRKTSGDSDNTEESVSIKEEESDEAMEDEECDISIKDELDDVEEEDVDENMKADESDDSEAEETESEEEFEEVEDSRQKSPENNESSSEEDDDPSPKKTDAQIRKSLAKQKPTKVRAILPGTNDFWSTSLDTINISTNTQAAPESSDDENEDDATTSKKKKRQTAAEKFKAAREEEARLRRIEENYANPSKTPETPDEFDRLVLANPNSSMTWINYMVFHLQAAEIDKARSIARKALKAISFRDEQERINVWIALLNLELRYGTKETFTEILKEATLCNDPFRIYTRCLQILADAKKVQELSDLIPTVTKKFKEKPEIWKYAASAYFEVDLVEKAKQLLHKAVAALPERDHVNTIVMFANLHHKNDDKDTAHTLLDQVVTSYPKRVDVWSQYVDILIKDNDIESARRTLERAVTQRIPLKKMRTLFKKYLDFEEKFGTDETVENVKQLAANYVKNEIES